MTAVELATEQTPEPFRLWSVTTLLDAGCPKGEALIGWAAKTVAEAGVDMSEAVVKLVEGGFREEAVDLLKGARYRRKRKALARGTDVHRIAESIALGMDVEIPPDVAPYVAQYQRFLDDHAPRFLMAEAPVYNLTYRYAGTLDAIAEIDGAPRLFDVKTNDKTADAEGARPPYKEIALQLVAYKRAEWVGVGKATMRNYNGRRYYIYDPKAGEYVAMPDSEGALALILFPDDYTLTPVRVDDDVFEAFLHVREVARWTLSTSNGVLGPPITATVHDDHQDGGAQAALEGLDEDQGQLGPDGVEP